MQRVQKRTPCLWFDPQAEEAAKFYCSIFDHSKITGTTHDGKAGHDADEKARHRCLATSL
jgi:predicted 3-demethylubiquinone-9 3-methyltransferase (glyoxalase superfamily)